MGYPGPGTIWNFLDLKIPRSQNPRIKNRLQHIHERKIQGLWNLLHTVFFDKNKETSESSGIS